MYTSAKPPPSTSVNRFCISPFNLYISVQVILDTLELSTKIKKTPVVVGNCTGFAVNRVFFPYTQVGVCMCSDSFPSLTWI